MQDFALTAYPKDATTTIRTGPPSVGLYAAYGKRSLDLILAALLLPAFALTIAVLWGIVRAGGGPGFFGHTRIGRNGKPFKCWKIRTMVADADAQLQAHLSANPQAAAEWARDHKLTDDPRISPLGRLLRKTSLDELPQIWNVIRGDMSFVGPRPVVAEEIIKYGHHAPAYLAQRPGLTGLWQISGRNDTSYGERVALDVAYLTRSSFGCDVVVIVLTARTMFNRTGR